MYNWLIQIGYKVWVPILIVLTAVFVIGLFSHELYENYQSRQKIYHQRMEQAKEFVKENNYLVKVLGLGDWVFVEGYYNKERRCVPYNNQIIVVGDVWQVGLANDAYWGCIVLLELKK